MTDDSKHQNATLCVEGDGGYLLHVKGPGTADVNTMNKMNMKNKMGRFLLVQDTTKPHAEGSGPYPSGSLFLQLAKTASVWVTIGGSPKRCDTSQYGTARLRGSVLG